MLKLNYQIFDQYFAPPLQIRRLLCMRRCAIIKHQQKNAPKKNLRRGHSYARQLRIRETKNTLYYIAHRLIGTQLKPTTYCSQKLPVP